MTIDRDKHRIELTGKVRAVRNDMTLASDRLVIEYEGSINDATSLNATGNVVIHIRDHTVIYSQWARMETDAGTVTLGDDVEFKQDGTLLKGKKLVIDLKTGRSKMTGGRVSGQFVPD
ncbi:MAG: LptA/OstA family protein [Hyphomicrobiales bacterium]